MNTPKIKILQLHSPDCPNHSEEIIPRLFMGFSNDNIEYRDAIGRVGNGTGERWARLQCNHTMCVFHAIVRVRDLENIVENLIVEAEQEARIL